jgi:hypothetical protein
MVRRRRYGLKRAGNKAGKGGVHAQRVGNYGTKDKTCVDGDELNFRRRVMLVILIVVGTIAVISWDEIGNWRAAFEAASAKILR